MKLWLTCTLTSLMIMNCFDSYSQLSTGAVLGEQLHYLQLRQGTQYHYYYPSIKGHQYLEKAVYTVGSLTLEGVLYEGELLNYDIYNGVVITPFIMSGLTENIILDNWKIDEFQIHQNTFVNIRDSSNILQPGIYEQVFQTEDIQYYIRAKKVVASNKGLPGDLLSKFLKQETFILIIEGRKNIIQRKKDLLQAFEGRQQILDYIKTTRLKFNNDGQTRLSLLKVLGNL